MDESVGILVFGATGLVGSLIVKYLYKHPEASSFRLGISGRNRDKLHVLMNEIATGSLNARPTMFIADITNSDEIDEVISKSKVVINPCGSYWTLGDPIVAACVKHRCHYLDLSGDIPWVRKLINEYDAQCQAEHIHFVHCCAIDALGSELGPYLAHATLKAVSPNAHLTNSISIIRGKGGMSSGTLNSIFSSIETIPATLLRECRKDYVLSPAVGLPYPRLKAWYTTFDPETKRNRIGMIFPNTLSNKHFVQRDWGLFEQDEDISLHYGPNFVYEEFVETGSRIISVLITILLFLSFFAIWSSKIVRDIIRKIFVNGLGVEAEQLERGWFEITNITTSTSSNEQAPLVVKTVLKGKGDPGYLCTAEMISEGALIALKGEGIGKGGVSSAMPAFGPRLVERLKQTGRFEFNSRIVRG
ncbi:hypothetical protein DL96DRAFT_1735016 [Flagelloscypha sp. PMI_526]|nr:hypothetical protein DL96DRAFT_1735016 [Flagelloscypha sp. PMI_526]